MSSVKVDKRLRLQTTTVVERYRARREAWRLARAEELQELISPSDWQEWDAGVLLQALEFARGKRLGAGVMADLLAAALARAELRGERRVRLDIEMERSSVRSEKP